MDNLTLKKILTDRSIYREHWEVYAFYIGALAFSIGFRSFSMFMTTIAMVFLMHMYLFFMKAYFNLKRSLSNEVDRLYEECDKIAARYGTRCSSVCINKIYYPHLNKEMPYVSMQARGKCKSIHFEDKIDLNKCIATFELMLISEYGKAKKV